MIGLFIVNIVLKFYVENTITIERSEWGKSVKENIWSICLWSFFENELGVDMLQRIFTEKWPGKRRIQIKVYRLHRIERNKCATFNPNDINYYTVYISGLPSVIYAMNYGIKRDRVRGFALVEEIRGVIICGDGGIVTVWI